LAAVWCRVAKPWVAFQATFGASTAAKAPSAARAACHVHAARASFETARCRTSPTRK
jgi:hypothetical protein